MELFKIYIKIFLMYICRVCIISTGIEITYFIICGIRILLRKLHSDIPIDFLPMEIVSMFAFSIAVLISLKTTYIVDGKRGVLVGDTFGFDPDKFKKDGEDK